MRLLRQLQRTASFLVIILMGSLSVLAQTVGVDTAQDLYSPQAAGGGLFSTSTGTSAAQSLNPASAGQAQRTLLDAGYLVLTGLGSETGIGHAISLGAIYPTKYAVFSGSTRLLSSPFDAFPIGTTFAIDLGVAKELYPGMTVGTGLNFGLGSDWTAALDLGFRYNMGKLYMLDDFTWAVVFGGLGKSFLPSPFTLAGGVSFDYLHISGKDGKPDPLRLGFATDLSIPTLTNLIWKLGLSATIAQIITISSSTGFNIQEALDGNHPSVIPSIGITANFTLKGTTTNQQGDVGGTLAAKPLYNDIWAFGTGVSWTMGVADKKPPVITIEYPETRYISPNNDGKADALEFPISITDQRYVDWWKFEIYDNNNNVVRTYRNKERRPETQGFRNVLDRILDVKSGVTVPETLRWDGILESGEVAPDGIYYFSLSAADDNENTATSPRYEVIVDTTAPIVEITSAGGSSDLSKLKIFSPDGDGNKDSFEIILKGSQEDLWDAGIYTAAGTKIRSFNIINGSPERIVWDGKNDNGAIVPDGVYSYRITATDRAHNSISMQLDNIIVNTERPVVSLLIGDSYFSPNGDAIKDTLRMSPGVPVKEGIVEWKLVVKNQNGTIVRNYFGKQSIPPQTDFDGRNDSGNLIAEGIYQAELSVIYQNGHIATTLSPTFVMDITAPSGTVQTEYPAFSPNNDGKQDVMVFIQEGSEEQSWQGEIRRIITGDPVYKEGSGVLVKTFSFAGQPDKRILWDGRDDAGRLAADGDFEYRLAATDRAGNRGTSNSVRFTLSTADTPVLVSTDLRAFSPNGDGVKDSINILPQLQVKDGIQTWKISIVDSSGKAVRNFEGRGRVPESILWNGKNDEGTVVSDGQYIARADITYINGNNPVAQSQTFTVDTIAPELSLKAPYTLFSPNQDGKKDFLILEIATSGQDNWKAEIADMTGKGIMSWAWKGAASDIRWNGTDNAGNQVTDGNYRLTVSATDDAGNRTSKSLEPITVDARNPRAFFTASALGISPNGDGKFDTTTFSIILNPRDGIESWKLEILSTSGSVYRTLGSGKTTPPETVLWDGKNDAGQVIEGSYTAHLQVLYTKGDVIEQTITPMVVDISGPKISFSTSPQYFSPDNDGVDDELTIRINVQDASPIATWNMEIREPEGPKQLFYRIEGRGTPASQYTWDGRSNKGELVQAATDYPVQVQAVDTLGNTSTIAAVIGIDVLVIREGDLLKIKVPSIIFRENAADFNNLPNEKVDNNLRVLRRIAEILNKFRDYRVKVEGHANPVTRTVKEETEELQPLSEARAKAIVEKLVEFGVDRSRLSYVGMGGSRPVVRYEDRDNWWKNRRVEFILIK
ncbi:FlgD immunoglobulin-like domain containing protein [Gracilinema caldarium]|uniref:OmpA/MotB domain protein n=1 Tax=Gracilinema caldarium (strain ATCC 51460 / DSM 7334 / H1) TaxID=744872 RepID=F8F3V5_GRAC1|nr:FlgD immunoglobulin-like domain containing protein [Gracilinema caldarium]AEJ20474.1 OmpA/MotB domain protein [Gracilinema caldarium DSM 7334]